MARRDAAACLLACLCATADAFGFRVEVALGEERDAAACAGKAVEAEIWKEVGDIYLQNYEVRTRRRPCFSHRTRTRR